jgi:hypothetical protein
MIAEYEAEGDLDNIYHEIKQILRVNGVHPIFCTWAGYEKFFPAMWDAIQPNLETRAFENAADHIRSEAAQGAARLGRLDAPSRVFLGESQAYQIRAALRMYHYMNPKLLVIASAVRTALGEPFGLAGRSGAGEELIERGVPPRMYPIEMSAEDPQDRSIRDIFDEIKHTLSLASINSESRTLALWPDYLRSAWNALKPLTRHPEYQHECNELRELAIAHARELPHPIDLNRRQVEKLGEDADQVVKTTGTFERVLPFFVLNTALLSLDWHSAEELASSPFPAAARPAAGVRKGGAG